MKTFLTTALVIVLIPVVLCAGMWVWAYYSTPALVIEAHNREIGRTAPVVSLSDLSGGQQQIIRDSRPVRIGLAEALFFYPGPYRANPFHNLQRSLFASALDKKLSPDEQLQLYVNHADFGLLQDKHVVGFAEASQTYFDKPLRQLDPEQLQALLDALQHKSIQSTP